MTNSAIHLTSAAIFILHDRARGEPTRIGLYFNWRFSVWPPSVYLTRLSESLPFGMEHVLRQRPNHRIGRDSPFLLFDSSSSLTCPACRGANFVFFSISLAATSRPFPSTFRPSFSHFHQLKLFYQAFLFLSNRNSNFVLHLWLFASVLFPNYDSSASQFCAQFNSHDFRTKIAATCQSITVTSGSNDKAEICTHF